MFSACALGQSTQTHTTVRKHREAVEDPIFTPELRQAEEALEQKDFPAAEKLLKQVVAADASNYRAWFDLGYLLNATEREKESIESYREAVKAKPDLFEANLNLGLMLAKAGDPEAEKYLRAATSLHPSSQPEEGLARAWLSLGQVLKTSKPQDALQAFQHAEQLQPKDAEPHLSAGLLLEQQNDYAGAMKEFQQAADLDPNSTEAVAGVANAAIKARQFDIAEASLRRYIALNPQSASAHVELGRVLVQLNRAGEGLPELEKGLQLSPGDSAAEKEIAAIYSRLQNYDEAARHLQSAMQKSPADPELHALLGESLVKLKRYPEAQDEFVRSLKLKPDQGEVYGALALAASQNQNYRLTIQALDARAKLMPEIPSTYFLRASAYDHLQNYKLAAENYHRFLDVAGNEFPDEEWQAKHRLIAIEHKR